MGIFDGYIIFSDYDGTLGHNKKISEQNISAIRHFQKNGGIFTLASGRYPDFVNSFAPDFVPNTYLISASGTIIYDPLTRKNVYECPADRSILDTVCEAFALMSGISDVIIFSDDRYTVIDANAADICDRILSVKFPVFKILLHTSRELSNQNTNILSTVAGNRFNVSRSWLCGLEIQSAESSKGIAIGKVCSMLGDEVKNRKIVCVGDYENDISMFKAADISYAVGNAPKKVKDIADRIAVPSSQNAIAQIICELEKEYTEAHRSDEVHNGGAVSP